MTLYELRSKIKQRMGGPQTEFEKGYDYGLEIALRLLKEVEDEIESRVSKLEKEQEYNDGFDINNIRIAEIFRILGKKV